MIYFICDSMKKFKILLIILLIIIMIPLGINFFVIYKTRNYINGIEEVNEKYDVALVLGCSVLKNNQPSKMLKDRLDMGIELYNKNKVSKILISGDHKDTYSEVEVMHKYLLDHNINEDDILIDYEGY